MPAKSKQQWKFMKMVEKGIIKKPGLSKEEAKEFTSNDLNVLVEKVKKKKK